MVFGYRLFDQLGRIGGGFGRRLDGTWIEG